MWNTDFISISCIYVLGEADFFPIINNIAHLRLLFSKINRKVLNDLEYVVTRGQIVHVCEHIFHIFTNREIHFRPLDPVTKPASDRK